MGTVIQFSSWKIFDGLGILFGTKLEQKSVINDNITWGNSINLFGYFFFNLYNQVAFSIIKSD